MFKLGALWQLRARAELTALLAEGAARARLAGRVEVGAVSGLKFLSATLPLGNARLAFDSDPAAGQPLVALQGELSTVAFGPLRLEPLAGSSLSASVEATRQARAVAVCLRLPAARVRAPGLAADTPLEIRPPAGQTAVVLTAQGGSATLAAPNGIKLLAPNGAVVLHVNVAASGTLTLDANGLAIISLSLPAGAQASLLPGDAVLRRDFALAQALAVTLRSDASFTVSLKLPPLVLDNGLFTIHGIAGASDGVAVVATEQEIRLAAAARLAVRVPGATAQTALLEQLSLRPDGSLAASGSQAVVDLPGLAKSTASTFGFERRGTAFRLKLGNVLLAFNALPGLSTRWDLELGPNLFSALCTASGALSCGFGTRLSIDAAQWSVQSTGFQSLTVSAKSGTVRLLGAAPLSVAAGGAVSLALAGPGGTGWLVDVAMNAALGADEFQTSVIGSGRSLFASSGARSSCSPDRARASSSAPA